MTWYEWVVGSFQFVGMWWLTDKVLRRHKRIGSWEAARQRALGVRSDPNKCTSCHAILWESPPGLCRRCRGVAALDFSRYVPSGVYASIEGALEAKKIEIEQRYKEILRQQSKMM